MSKWMNEVLYMVTDWNDYVILMDEYRKSRRLNYPLHNWKL